MKKTLLNLLAILALTANWAVAQTYSYPVKGQQGFSLTEKTRDGMHISYELGQFTLDQLNYRGETMSEISIKGIAIPNTAGSPNLPTESRMMAIPTGAKATLNVVHFDTETFHNVNIAPALRIQVENEEPDMDYKKDMKVYSRNAFYPENPFTIGNSYIRGVDAVTVSITPFQYNPVTKDLVVYTNVELSVSYEGGNGHFGEDRLRSPYWDPILAAELMNYDQLPVIDYEARMQQWLRDGAEGAEYLIITPNNDAWAPYAQQLKEFRMKQGIITEVYRLDEMPATSTTQMKTWFHNAYHTWEIAPVAVCMLGDHGTNMSQYIPAEEVYHSSSYGNCITDNRYADAQGNDNLPDMVFSRLVAQNAAELPVFVSKQIDYETSPNTDPSFYSSPITALGWQDERWFQICSEVFGGYMRNHGYTPQRINCIYSGTPGNSWSSAQNTSDVVNYFGPNGQNYIPASPSELGGWTGGTPQQVVQAVNNGTFWVQHRDHGLDEGWGEPAVRNEHIDQMNNVGKLPFVMSINCQTGMFDYTGSNGNCFTEKWMRRTFNGQNAGAVGVLSPTQVSYSFVNDAFVWGVYDLFDGDFMPDYGPFQPAAPKTGNWMPAFGNVAGKYFLAQSAWPYNADSKDITYTMFTAHCDAFLRIYTQVPQTMAVNHQNVQLAGLNTFQVTAPEGTTIALTKGEGENLEIVAVAQATGSVQNITIPPQVPPTVLKLTVTGQNYFRYVDNIDVIPSDGPYIIINEYELSNEATQLNFGEQAGFDIQLKNVGNSQAPAGTMTITTASEYVTLINDNVAFGAINSNATENLHEAFVFAISDEVPNKTNIEFIVNITSGDDTYENHITMKAYAPDFEIGNVNITEIEGNGNGRLDPGERVRLSFPVENKGNADSRDTEIELVMNNIFLTITSDPVVTMNSIAADETAHAEYEIYVGGAPSGFAAEFTLNAVSGVYTATKDFVSKIGLNVEDFESEELDPSMWTNDVPYPWTFVSDDPYEGQYCLKSGTINHSQETVLSLNYQVGEADSIAFYYKVSSENGYDKLFFYIDGQEKNNWSGNVAWTRAQYAVTAGRHSFTWKYKKDSSVSSGSDCAWIDFVILPRDMSLTCSAGLDLNTCSNAPVQINGYASNYTSLEWTTAGNGTFDDATLMNPVYTPGSQDIANGSVVLTMTAHKDDETLSDDMTLNIYETVTISIPTSLLPIVYCAVEEPQGIAVEVEGDYSSFEWTTSGTGVFDNANELATNYTPSEEDILNGVTLTATATSLGCGPVSFEYPFEMNPMPELTLENESIEVCEGENAIMNFTMTGSAGTLGAQPEFTFGLNEATNDAQNGANTLDLGVLEVGTHVFNIGWVSNITCTTEYGTDERTFTVTVKPAPTMTFSEVPESVCEGTEVQIDFVFTGTAPFIVDAIGMEGFTAESNEHSINMLPSENINAMLTKVTDATGCETVLEQAINVTVNPIVEIPEISGNAELDVRLTPISTYTITNDVMVRYTLEPEYAGTITGAYDDAQTIDIEWNEAFKGEVVLTAMPLSECNNGSNSMTITVRNSTGVDEWANSAKIYPNPTSEKVYVEAEGMTHIAVYSIMGQLVYDTDVNSDRVSIDMTRFPAGTYLVRIHTHEGICTRHLDVMR